MLYSRLLHELLTARINHVCHQLLQATVFEVPQPGVMLNDGDSPVPLPPSVSFVTVGTDRTCARKQGLPGSSFLPSQPNALSVYFIYLYLLSEMVIGARSDSQHLLDKR